MSARKLARLALLTAVALSLFVVELQLPDLFPIPGAKLGLANIITVYALYRCRAGEAAMVLAARILLGGLLGGWLKKAEPYADAARTNQNQKQNSLL